jgi:outer membrane protein assembly factor BamB
MFITMPKWLLCFTLVIGLSPINSIAQSGTVTFEKLWDRQVGSAVYGGVQIDDAYLYAGAEDGILRAVDKQSGDVAWTFNAGAAIASNVTVDDKRIYFHSRDGVVHALDKSDGSALWTFSTQGERRWDYWDYYLSTPAVDDRQLYFGSGDHHIYAVDKLTGQLRWKVKTGNIVHGEPIISGEKVIIGGFEGLLYAIDRGTGRVLWTFKTVGNAYFRNGEIPGAATVKDGIVYFGGRDYNIYALLEETGTGAWNDMTPSWIVGRPLVIDDELIVVNSDGSTVFSYNGKTGQVNWEFKNSYNMFAGAKALGSGYLAIASLDGRITVLSREDGGQTGFFETDDSIAARDEFFNDDGSLDYTGIRSLEGIQGLYERQLIRMDGIPGSIVVEKNIIYYAAVSGEIAAIRVNGIELPAEEQP